MAGGIPLSAKFDVSIAEPLDSKLESVSTFSELASTEFPYKGMQKLVEDEGDNGVIYVLGNDLVTWNVLVADKVDKSDLPTKTTVGAIKADYDATTSTLEISIDGTDIL